jgi:hypothetical protein
MGAIKNGTHPLLSSIFSKNAKSKMEEHPRCCTQLVVSQGLGLAKDGGLSRQSINSDVWSLGSEKRERERERRRERTGGVALCGWECGRERDRKRDITAE